MGRPPVTAETASASIEHVLMTVATRLKNARQQLKMTQKYVAEKADLQQSYVYEIETGKTNITLRTLVKLAEVLNLDIRSLFPITDSVGAATRADDALHVFLDKTRAVLQDYQKEDAERHRRQMELLAELQSLMHLRTTVETPAPPVQ
jgi:transcriptional regulator with XRE-family HTH domain